MTSTATAAPSGSTSTATRPERLSGMAAVRQARAYHEASIMHDAAYEAERLCNDIYRAVSDAYMDRTGTSTSTSTSTAVLDDPVTQKKIRDALQCLASAQQWLFSLGGDEPPA